MKAWRVSPDVTCRLILVRHGEPDPGVHGRCYGRLDAGLSAQGRKQARQTGRWLRDAPISSIFCSPRQRAVESAAILAQGRHIVKVDGRLREIDFGDFEGLTYAEIALRFPDTYEEWMARPTAVTFPGGESFAAMVERVRDALEGVRNAHVRETVAIVSHGGVNRIALARALALDECRIFRLDQAYGCVNVIDYFGDEPLVRLVNGLPAGRC